MVGLVWLRGATTLFPPGDHSAAPAPFMPQIAFPALLVLDVPVMEAIVLPALELRVLPYPVPPVWLVAQ